MSRNMRPIYTEWGPYSGVFVFTDNALTILTALADEAGVSADVKNCNHCDTAEVMVQDAAKFLDYLENLDVKAATVRLAEYLAPSEYLNDWDGGPLEDDPESLHYLLVNLKALAPEWRTWHAKMNEGRHPPQEDLFLLVDY